MLDDETVNIIASLYEEEKREVRSVKASEKKKAKKLEEEEEEIIEEEEKKKKEEEILKEKIRKTVHLSPEELKLNILAEKIKVPLSKIIKDHFMRGIILRPAQGVNLEEARQIAAQYGWNIELKEEKISDPIEALKEKFDELYKDESKLVQRPPVVTVMGHVDHGKTTLLDRIRKTTVAEKEVGGITQSIGAYQAEIDGKKITFIDTPGHEAFTEMRARGAQATDIVVLVVAADDGVMPQTIEAFNHAKTANVPIIVAINKIDKPNANIDLTKQQLASKLGLVPEDWGGDTIVVPISAKMGKGIDELLEMILLVAEMSEIKCIPQGNARGVIIESELDKGVGPLATAIIKDGIIKPGDYIVAGSTHGKVRALRDEKGRKVKNAGPSDPVQIIGFEEVPDMHEILYVVDSLDQAREISAFVKERQKKERMVKGKKHVRLEEFMRISGEGERKILNLIIKSDSFGAVEALKQAIAKLETEEVHIEIVHSGIGPVNGSDVMLAAASDAVIIGYKVKPDSQARSQAEEEGVQIKIYEIIFDLIDDLKKALEGLLEPEEVDEVVGHGEVKQVFKIKKLGNIAGVQLQNGYVTKDGFVRVYRRNEEIFDGKIESLKHYKEEVNRVDAPKECGIKLLSFDDIQEGDKLEFHVKRQVKRTLEFKDGGN
nr:translation initiation factor IF-2 [Kosmotoga pacifica]